MLAELGNAGHSASDAAAARKDLAHIFSTGPIDSVDQWEALSSGGGAKDGPRKEVLLAGIDSDKRGTHRDCSQCCPVLAVFGSDNLRDLAGRCGDSRRRLQGKKF